MPPSVPNESGTHDPAKVPYGKWDSFAWKDFEEWAGAKSIIYRSEDGSRIAGAFHETAAATLTYTYDEFTYVVKGWLKCHVHGGETFTLNVGDVVYFIKGQTVDFESSQDYVNISMFIDTERITLV